MSMSYQHIYHAGNPADIHKHLWILAVLGYLQQKDTPLFWCDTHAGRGVYDLNSTEAQKTQEFNSGIAKLYHEKIDHPLWSEIKRTIDEINPDEDSEFYPGTALMVARRLRAEDRMECYDPHPQEFMHLEKAMSPYKNVLTKKIRIEEGIFSCTPPKESRGAIFVDPSYEIKTEYKHVPKIVKRVIKKWPNGTYMLWYPMLAQNRHKELKDACRAIDEAVIFDEWVFDNPKRDGFRGMYGTGMAVFNAPYSVPETIAECRDIFLPLLKKN